VGGAGRPGGGTRLARQPAAAAKRTTQSEFLQLFSFVVLAALFIHRGSAESKDSVDRMEAALKRMEERLDRLAPSR
jgi:hypothetical protein